MLFPTDSVRFPMATVSAAADAPKPAMRAFIEDDADAVRVWLDRHGLPGDEALFRCAIMNDAAECYQLLAGRTPALVQQKLFPFIFDNDSRRVCGCPANAFGVTKTNFLWALWYCAAGCARTLYRLARVCDLELEPQEFMKNVHWDAVLFKTSATYTRWLQSVLVFHGTPIQEKVEDVLKEQAWECRRPWAEAVFRSCCLPWKGCK